MRCYSENGTVNLARGTSEKAIFEKIKEGGRLCIAIDHLYAASEIARGTITKGLSRIESSPALREKRYYSSTVQDYCVLSSSLLPRRAARFSDGPCVVDFTTYMYIVPTYVARRSLTNGTHNSTTRIRRDGRSGGGGGGPYYIVRADVFIPPVGCPAPRIKYGRIPATRDLRMGSTGI